jgi:hypothetical protein
MEGTNAAAGVSPVPPGNSRRRLAPDVPGFGFSDAPDHQSFSYTSDHLAEIMGIHLLLGIEYEHEHD